MNTNITISATFKDLFFSKKRYKLFYGGRGCFSKGQEVLTEKGYKPIEEVNKGEKVCSYNEITGKYELKPVIDTHKHEKTKDKLITLNLKDGSKIKVTENHEFYFGGEWVKIKDIISIFDEWKSGKK